MLKVKLGATTGTLYRKIKTFCFTTHSANQTQLAFFQHTRCTLIMNIGKKIKRKLELLFHSYT